MNLIKFIISLLFVGSVWGQITAPFIDFGPYSVSDLPVSGRFTGQVYLISDGDSSGDCSVGGGSEIVWCMWNGGSWINAGGASGASAFTDLTGVLQQSQMPTGTSLTGPLGSAYFLGVTGQITASTATIGSGTLSNAGVSSQRTTNDANGNSFTLLKARSDDLTSPAQDSDSMGRFRWRFVDSDEVETTAFYIESFVEDNTDTTEDGYAEFYAMRGGSLVKKLTINDRVVIEGDSYFDMAANASPGTPDTDWTRFYQPATDEPIRQRDDTGTDLRILSGTLPTQPADCTAQTGEVGDTCVESDGDVFICKSTDGACDSAGEWQSVGAAGLSSYFLREHFHFSGVGTGLYSTTSTELECNAGSGTATTGTAQPDSWRLPDDGDDCIAHLGVVPTSHGDEVRVALQHGGNGGSGSYTLDFTLYEAALGTSWGSFTSCGTASVNIVSSSSIANANYATATITSTCTDGRAWYLFIDTNTWTTVTDVDFGILDVDIEVTP